METARITAVVPVQMCASQLVDRSAAYCKEFRNSLLKAPLTLEQAARLVKARVKDALSVSLRWMTPNDEFHSVLSQLVEGYDCEITATEQRNFYHYIFSDVERGIEEMVGSIVSGHEWKIWTLEPLYIARRDAGTAVSIDCILHSGEDYRIYEWDRLRRKHHVDYPFMRVKRSEPVTSEKLIYPTEDNTAL